MVNLAPENKKVRRHLHATLIAYQAIRKSLEAIRSIPTDSLDADTRKLLNRASLLLHHEVMPAIRKEFSEHTRSKES